ncbi:MAG: hypothetical protein QOF51_3463 [Chloroflexota bacterium]|nr:hypothetical protein [Chloroflexota bacterium]
MQGGLPLQGRVALVTGSSSGIGAAIAVELGRQGADVCVNYHSEKDQAEEIASQIRATGRRAIVVGGDVATSSDVQAMVDATVQQLGGLDILVNNAGIEHSAPFLEFTERQWDLDIGVNLKGVFLCSQAAARQMVQQGRGGRIINISSVHEDLPFPGYTAYVATKGGVRMLTRNLALELAPHRINVVGVAPGAIATPINQATLEDPEKIAALNRQIPLGRIGTGDDVAQVAAFLASDAASYITATTVFVDGGLMHQALPL